MRLPKRRSLKPAPRPSPPPLLRERGPDAATRPRGPWAHLASFTCRVPPVGNFRETRLLAPPRGQCAVGGRARGPLRGPLRGARASTCAKPRRSVRGARQELKARRQKAAGRPRLFHAPSLFPMKLCLASPFKFPPPFETHFGCGRRHPSVAARAAAFASAPSTRGAPRGPRHSLFEPGLSAGRRSRRQHVGPPGVPRNCPGRGDRWRPKSPDVVEPKQTRSSRARRHAHLPPGGLVAAE